MGHKSLTVGKKVVRLGEHFNLSQERLAELLGISRSTIATYKARDNANPTEDKFREWADRFGIPVEWFLDGEDTDPPTYRDWRKAESEADVDRMIRNASASTRNKLHKAAYRNKVMLTSNVTPLHPDDMTFDEEDFASSEMLDIPVWQGVVAGLDDCHFVEEKHPRVIHVPKFFFSRKNPERFIMALPKGTSMAPRIISPDRVISILTPDPPPNSIVVARSVENVNFIKVLRVNRMGRKTLHSINPDFPPIEDVAGWVLRAAVVGIWKPYEKDGPNIEFNGGSPLRG